ncbi:MAG: chemotaxis protein CheB [Candidatus Margulisbacteria bacterium]|nr:chemotaxis protein CheB [Candidatus Margulisiibacteriota bacterium]
MKHKYKMVIIGGSAGSLSILKTFFFKLNPSFPLPIVIITHTMPDNGQRSKEPPIIQHFTSLPVIEPSDKEEILPAHVYVAPANYHLLFDQGLIVLSADPPEMYNRPSINVAFESAADEFGDELFAILLTGANSDGAKGLSSIKQKGGHCIVQDPEDAEFPDMPRAAIKLVKDIDDVLPANSIVQRLNSMIIG